MPTATTLKNAAIVAGMSLATLAGAELLFRHALFNGWKSVAHLRQPGLYAKNYPDTTGAIFSQDYWTLYTLFGGERKPPENPQKELGWSGYFDRETLVHQDAARVGKRRPVLLYGDSFSACVNVDCFQDILNVDSAFAHDHYLLNYGVGGYGIDQIHLLCSRTVGMYERPFVVFGLMTRDMERCMLHARIGQKPYYTLDGDSLVLHNTPIDPDQRKYYDSHRPDITSYLWRLLQHRVTGDSLADGSGTEAFKAGMRDLTAALLRATVRELRAKNVDALFLVFEPMYNTIGDWRSLYIRSVLESEHVPYLFTGDIVWNDGYRQGNYARYEQLDNGHPTLYQNRLIGRAITRYLLDSTYADSLAAANTRRLAFLQAANDPATVEHYITKIFADSTWLASVMAKALERGIPLDSMLRLDADWVRRSDSLERVRKP